MLGNVKSKPAPNSEASTHKGSSVLQTSDPLKISCSSALDRPRFWSPWVFHLQRAEVTRQETRMEDCHLPGTHLSSTHDLVSHSTMHQGEGTISGTVTVTMQSPSCAPRIPAPTVRAAFSTPCGNYLIIVRVPSRLKFL